MRGADQCGVGAVWQQDAAAHISLSGPSTDVEGVRRGAKARHDDRLPQLDRSTIRGSVLWPDYLVCELLGEDPAWVGLSVGAKQPHEPA
jgi:hypothetical protein